MAPQIKKNDFEKAVVVCLNAILYAVIPTKRIRKIIRGGTLNQNGKFPHLK
jgi:hypothetical protein